MNITMYKIVTHFLMRYLNELETQKVAELHPFFEDFFTKSELIEILKKTLDKETFLALTPEKLSNTELLKLIKHDKYILKFFLEKYSALVTSYNLTPVSVWNTLEQLGLQTHYLGQKAIPTWDEYDHSNYKSLARRAGKVIKVYGIYDSMVTQEAVNDVETHPKRFFENYDLTKEKLQEFIDSGTFKEDETHILYRYLSLS